MTTEKEITLTGTNVADKIGFKATASVLGNWPADTKFIKDDEELEEMGNWLINKYRADLKSLTIKYVFKQKAGKNGDTPVVGATKADSDLQRVLYGTDATIIIGWDEWNTLDVDNKLRTLLYELEKLSWDDKTGKLKIRTPEVAQFPMIIKVFGPSSSSEIDFISAYQSWAKDNGGTGI